MKIFQGYEAEMFAKTETQTHEASQYCGKMYGNKCGGVADTSPRPPTQCCVLAENPTAVLANESLVQGGTPNAWKKAT